MATHALTPAAQGTRAGLYSWLTTTDHKKIGILYLINSFIFFFLAGLLAYRDANKLRQTVEGLQKAIAEDGRVHTTYMQNVAATGRLSSTNPNLQNIPVRTEEGRRIRGL